MAKAYLLGRMAENMKANGLKINFMEPGHMKTMMGANTRENLNMIKCKGKDSLYGRMGINI